MSGATPTHEEALELLAIAARKGESTAAIVAYERAMWRELRDADADSKKNKGKKSRDESVLDSI